MIDFDNPKQYDNAAIKRLHERILALEDKQSRAITIIDVGSDNIKFKRADGGLACVVDISVIANQKPIHKRWWEFWK